MRLIDADALKEAMYHEAFEKDTDMQKWDGGCWIRYKMFENKIKEAPTIEERKTDWIPVTERLPEKADSYLITYLGESGKYAGLVPFVDCAYWGGYAWEIDCEYTEDVIAWMPLPKPYEEGAEE